MEQRRWQLPWAAVTLYDPLLQVGGPWALTQLLVAWLGRAPRPGFPAAAALHGLSCSHGLKERPLPIPTPACPQPVRRGVFGQKEEGDLVSRQQCCLLAL